MPGGGDSLRKMRFLVAFGIFLTVATALWADRATDLVRIHVEAIGGRERLAALASFRANGSVVVAGQEMRFTMTAARPNRVRLETERGGRMLVQGTDGNEPAWEYDSDAQPPRVRAMTEGAAKTFVADAEFDDPLVGGVERGYAFDFAGEMEIDGRKFLRLLVSRKLQEPFSVLLDPGTYLLVMRIEQRTTVLGRKVQVMTRYGDFRPVQGVLLPHEVTTVIEGRTSQQTKIASIVPNPMLVPDPFGRPKAAGIVVEKR